MSASWFSKLEIDAIGEIMNISLGASATAVSTMLNAKVDITTPHVTVVSKEEFRMEKLEPAVGVEITYVSGLEGKNVMLLKRHDVKVIVEMLMGMQMEDEEFELNEMNISAICEVMNQMMGASSTALSEFLGRMVNISTPISFEVKSDQEFIEKYFTDDRPKVVIGFVLKIADKLESEFFNVMPVELAKGLVKGFLPESEIVDISSGVPQEKAEESEEQEVQEAPAEPEPVEDVSSGAGGVLSQEDIEKLLQGEDVKTELEEASQAAAEEPQAAEAEPATVLQQTPPAPESPAGQSAMSADMSMMQMQMMQQMMQQMQAMQQQMQEQQEKVSSPEPKMINVQAAANPALRPGKDIVLEGVQEENMELIMSVPLEISVEIGRTKKLVKDILDFTKGSLVVLDKLAGEQVDLYVNGQCIAKGDVVVVEDNFGIRITEIMKVNLITLE